MGFDDFVKNYLHVNIPSETERMRLLMVVATTRLGEIDEVDPEFTSGMKIVLFQCALRQELEEGNAISGLQTNKFKTPRHGDRILIQYFTAE